MSYILKVIFFAIIFYSTYFIFTNMGKGSVVMTSSSSGATMVTTDIFGNRQTCKTDIVGSGTYATMITRCN